MTLLLDAAINNFEPALPLGIALSGGADSTALLWACASRWPGQVQALHVNHGLQEAAAVFEQHCHTVCQQLGVPLRVQHVHAHPRAGQSPEDAARQARYQALSTLAQADANLPALAGIAIAQHADDQVETILLAMGRGAGLAGISGMPAHWQRAGLDFYRPLLQVSGAEVRRWLTLRQGRWIEDPTNTSQAFTRNRIRAHLLPALQQALPQFRDTFARTAAHAAQAQALLDEVALADLSLVCLPPAKQPHLKALQTMGRARQSNVLRYWLKSSYQVIPSAAQLAELLDQIAACTTRGHRIHIKVGLGFVLRRAAVLTWYNPAVSLTTLI